MKAPAFMFYVGDWMKDPAVRRLSLVNRGIWIDLLCFMFESERRGELVGTAEQLARLAGCTRLEMDSFLAEVKQVDLCDFRFGNEERLDGNGEITLINRRMVRDEKARRDNANRQARWKTRQRGDTEVTTDSQKSNRSSSSSSSSSKIPPTPQGAPQGLSGKAESNTAIAQKVIDLWNSTVTRLPKVGELTDVRQGHILARLKDRSIEKLGELFHRLDRSDLAASGAWASFDWIMKSATNAAKVQEGNYDNRNGATAPGPTNGKQLGPTPDEYMAAR
jgi:hypothetical protein